jgi:hypothetical protein
LPFYEKSIRKSINNKPDKSMVTGMVISQAIPIADVPEDGGDDQLHYNSHPGPESMQINEEVWEKRANTKHKLIISSDKFKIVNFILTTLLQISLIFGFYRAFISIYQ